jgi:hypothetical protein
MSYKDRIFIKTSDNIAKFVEKSNNTLQKVGDLNLFSAAVHVDSDVVGAISSIADSIGTATLNTTAQTIKGAINEHETDIGNMTFTGLSATNISAAIRELRTELGDHTALTTTQTSNVVAAINEINSELYATPDGSGANFTTDASTIEGAINEMDGRLDSVSTNLGTLNSDRDSTAALIGQPSFDTTATTIIPAINELDSDIGEISNLSDSVRAENSTAVDAINFVWNYAKQIDSDQVSGTNLLGNLSILDIEIRENSFALSVNALRDSLNSLVDSVNSLNSSRVSDISSLVDSVNSLNSSRVSDISNLVDSLNLHIDSAFTASNISSTDGALSFNAFEISHRTSSVTKTNNNSDITFIQDINFDSHGHATSITSTTIGAGTDLSNSGSTINHDTISRTNTSSSSTLTPSGTFTAISAITSSTQGHVTAVTTKTNTMPAIGDTLYIYDAAGGSPVKTIKSYT